MPVQINEMIIRANIREGEQRQTEVKTDDSSKLNKEEIIKECTELIMEMINKKNDR